MIFLMNVKNDNVYIHIFFKTMISVIFYELSSSEFQNFHLLFQVGPREADYDTFLGDLIAKDGEADDCRYAIYDFEFTVQTQGTEALNR